MTCTWNSGKKTQVIFVSFRAFSRALIFLIWGRKMSFFHESFAVWDLTWATIVRKSGMLEVPDMATAPWPRHFCYVRHFPFIAVFMISKLAIKNMAMGTYIDEHRKKDSDLLLLKLRVFCFCFHPNSLQLPNKIQLLQSEKLRHTLAELRLCENSWKILVRRP